MLKVSQLYVLLDCILILYLLSSKLWICDSAHFDRVVHWDLIHGDQM